MLPGGTGAPIQDLLAPLFSHSKVLIFSQSVSLMYGIVCLLTV